MNHTVIYVLSEVYDAPGFAWIAENSKRAGWRVFFVLMNNGEGKLERQLVSLGVGVERIPYRGRADFFRAFFSLCRAFLRLRPRTVHTHLLAANLAGLTAAWLMRVPNRLYTRHHSNWHENGPWHAKLYDQFSNFMATRIVATCQNVKDYLIRVEKVKPEKIELIHPGFECGDFENVSAQRILAIKNKYRYGEKSPVIGVVSRYISCKGVPYAISAFSGILEKFPNACLVLANAGNGSARREIKSALGNLPEGSYREIAFESDAPALMQSFDVFVHVPVDRVSEAFGQVYIEALLNAVPSVATLSGVAPEILRHRENALIVPYCDSGAIREGLFQLLQNPELGRRIAAHGAAEARARFPMEKMMQGLRNLYQ